MSAAPKSTYGHSVNYFWLPVDLIGRARVYAVEHGLLDEQQRRLLDGLELIKLGHGGDSVLAEFLGLDPHTVARGRQQLLDQNVSTGRTRRSGGGRKPVAGIVTLIEFLLEYDLLAIPSPGSSLL